MGSVMSIFSGVPMRTRIGLPLVLLGLLSLSALADVELKEKGEGFIRIGQPAGDSWLKEDEVCVVRDGSTVDCGRVTQSEADSAIVRLSSPEQILPGDRVQSYLEIEEENTRGYATVGVTAGFGYYFPHLQLQYKLDESWFIGVMGSLSSNEEDLREISSKGAFLSINHYAKRAPFRGFWFRAAAGAYFLNVKSATQEESGVAPAVLSTVGWRGVFAQWVTLGAGVGLQYVPNQINMVPLGLRNLEPVMTVDLGLRF